MLSLLIIMQGHTVYADISATMLPALKTVFRKIKKPLPLLLRQKVSISGTLTVREALMLIARQVNFPVEILEGVGDASKNYYINKLPLFKALGIILDSHGYIYKFRNNELYIYGTLTSQVELPVNDLKTIYSSKIGTMGNTNGSNVQGGFAGSIDGSSGTSNNANGMKTSNPGENSQNTGGNINLSFLSSGKNFKDILKKDLRVILGHKGTFFINDKNGIVWLSGRAASVITAVNYLKRVKADLSKQVFLKVEVVDVRLGKNFQYGINWNLLFNDAFKANTLEFSKVSLTSDIAQLSGLDSNSPGIIFSGSGGNSAVIEALKKQGAVTVISQPRLMLTDGETRIISNGTVTPYVESVQTLSYGAVSGQTQTSPQMAEVQTGISISFTPHILSDGKVSVTVVLLDDSISGFQTFTYDGDSFTNPTLQTKSLASTVTVGSGETIVLGGTLTKEMNKTAYAVPVLADIPLLGRLFSGEEDSFSKDALVIMLTPLVEED